MEFVVKRKLEAKDKGGLIIEMSNRQFQLDQEHKMILGVCAGIARHKNQPV